MLVIRIIQGNTIEWSVVSNDSQVKAQMHQFADLLIKLSIDNEDYTFNSDNIDLMAEELIEKRELRMSGDNGIWEITLTTCQQINSRTI